MEELRQKHEEALLAVAVDMDDGENEAEEAVDSPDGNEAGFITALREVKTIFCPYFPCVAMLVPLQW